MLTSQDVREIITDRIKKAGSQRAFAEEVGVTVAYVNDYIHFRRDPGPTLLAAVGLREVNAYERIAP